ncbi:MAG: MBL fold metallo-hydrolase [Tissierellia bacterium]|nr:MBL fold metallo-hydrolase [Tissierellia bacterium]
MEVTKIEVGQLQTNCYVIHDKKSNEMLIVDPGADYKVIENVLKSINGKLKYIVLTHAHGDHIGAVKEIIDNYPDVKLLIHSDDALRLETPALNMSSMIFGYDISIIADEKLNDGDIIKLGDEEIGVIHTPGHSEGCICLLFGNELITGDTLFNGSIGRTDLIGGDYNEIINSIHSKILPLKDEIIVYPGHGPSSTIGKERVINPYLKGLV